MATVADASSADNHQEHVSLTGNVIFLLITETSLDESRPHSIQWHCCLMCNDFKSTELSALLTHIQCTHNSADPYVYMTDPFPVDKEVDLSQVMLHKQIITLNTLDPSKPLISAVIDEQQPQQLDQQAQSADTSLFQCSHCDKTFTQLRYLKQHLPRHEREQCVYCCKECGKQCQTLLQLESHIKIVHLKLTKGYECKQCDFTSTVKIKIHNHRQLHSDGSVLCTICGLSYTDKGTLKRHKEVHSLSRPFPCPFENCFWRFLTESKRDAHLRNHINDGRFKCRFCEKCFRQRHHLSRHEVAYHDVAAATPRPYTKLKAKSDISAMDPSSGILPST